MTRPKALVPLLLTLLVLVGACKNNSSSSSGTAADTGASQPAVTQSAPSSANPVASSAAGADANGCPESNTTAFAKTKFVLHAAEAFGTFHRYIYKPLRAGGFRSGAPHRFRTFLKAGATALFDKRQVRLMIEDVKANPTLCKAIAQPLSDLSDKLDGIGHKIRTGDTSGIEDAQGAIGAIEDRAKSQGAGIQEDPNASTG